MNKYILPVYEIIFETKFEHDETNCRIKMQNTIYLLQELGTSLGDYGFRLSGTGVYSASLAEDMQDDNPNGEIRFSNDSRKNIDRVKTLIASPNDYNQQEWTECLAYMLYLRKYVLPSNSDMNHVLESFTTRKPHLNNENANKTAYALTSGY